MDNEVLMYCRSARSIIDVDLDSMSVELKEIEKRDRRVGRAGYLNGRGVKRGCRITCRWKCRTFEEGASCASVDFVRCDAYDSLVGGPERPRVLLADLRMADRDPEERTQYKKVHDDVVDYNLRGTAGGPERAQSWRS